MTTTYTWSILDLGREITDGYVFSVTFSLTAQNGVHSVEKIMTVGLERHEDLIPFDELTHDLIVMWLKELIEDEVITEWQIDLEKQLDQKMNPDTLSGLPWVT